ncbi:PDZ domain [Trinorchestia longiramus]|nr:PDZ domain [Trinorchestia longiramus]
MQDGEQWRTRHPAGVREPNRCIKLPIAASLLHSEYPLRTLCGSKKTRLVYLFPLYGRKLPSANVLYNTTSPRKTVTCRRKADYSCGSPQWIVRNGSPADKADLEVGDEILEVNGRSLEDATHTEVIAHIHQCIRSRTICLRVKRRQGSKIAHDLAATANVQDAFVIAVEQQARERLERLSALKKIKPVDMTKLPHQEQEKTSSGRQQQQQQLLQQQQQQQDNRSSSSHATQSTAAAATPGVEDAAGKTRRSNGFETSVAAPLYVTSVPSLASAGPGTDQSNTPKANGAVGAETSRPPQDADGEAYKSGDELELTQEIRGDTTDDDLDDAEADASGRRRGPRRGRGSRRSGLGRSRADEESIARPVSTDRSEDELDRSSSQKFEVEGACLSESGESLPGTPEKTYGLVSHDPPVRVEAPPAEGLVSYDSKNRSPATLTDCRSHVDEGKLPLTATSSGASSR